MPVIDVDSSHEQSLDEIPDALAWLDDNFLLRRVLLRRLLLRRLLLRRLLEKLLHEAMNADTEHVANEPQRKRIRAKRPPQPVPVPKTDPSTAQPAAEAPSSSTGDQGWTAEEWKLWTEAVRASNKKGSKGRKRKLQLYERFRSLKEQGLWKGTDPKPKYPGQG